MSYGLMYKIPFSSSLGKDYVVEIEKEGYIGEYHELVADETPFVVNRAGEDFIYSPLRTSTATINVFGDDYLRELYSTDYRQYRVLLKCENSVLWSGFVKPEVYTQEYGDEEFSLSIECVSAIEVLDKIDYKNDSRDFVSLWNLISYCIEESCGLYKYVYFPLVYSLDADNILEKLTVSTQNFFDEDGEAMTCKEILEEICKVMNWTLVDWGGSLYFVDPDNINGEYAYSEIGGTIWKIIASGIQNVQAIGYDGDNHTLDIVGGYNKAVVKCSNYPVGDALPDTSFSNLKVLTKKDEKRKLSESGGNEVSHYKFYTSKDTNFELIPYKYGKNIDDVESLSPEELINIIQDTPSWKLASLTGAIPYKYDIYEEDAEGYANQIDYDYAEEIRIKTSRTTSQELIFSQQNRIPIVRIRGNAAVYSTGAFIIDFKLIMSAINTLGVVDYDFHFQLRVGKYYFHGTTGGKEFYWDNDSSVVVGEYDNNLEVDFGTDNNNYTGPYTLKTSRKLNDGLNGLSGFICRLPDNMVLSGDIELIIYAPFVAFTQGGARANYFSIQSFSFDYHRYNEDDEDNEEETDRMYENMVNENYVNELDEIELKISTYNNDGACFSKLVMDGEYITDNIYCRLVDKNVRLEELLIQRIIGQYKSPHIKLTQQLCNVPILPINMLTDDSQPGRLFMCTGGEIDYQGDTQRVILMEVFN